MNSALTIHNYVIEFRLKHECLRKYSISRLLVNGSDYKSYGLSKTLHDKQQKYAKNIEGNKKPNSFFLFTSDFHHFIR